MSKKPLKMKDLINIEFTPIKDGEEKKALITKDVSVFSSYVSSSLTTHHVFFILSFVYVPNYSL